MSANYRIGEFVPGMKCLEGCCSSRHVMLMHADTDIAQSYHLPAVLDARPRNARITASRSTRVICDSVFGLSLKRVVVSDGGIGKKTADHFVGYFINIYRGCITGNVLENIRNGIEDPGNPGQYRWDYLDGYEGDDKDSLQKHPEFQAKVRRVITQGFIDPEDWRGVSFTELLLSILFLTTCLQDPEMNVLGQKGMRTKDNMKKLQDEKKANKFQEQIDELNAQLAGIPNDLILKDRIEDLEAKRDRLLTGTPTPKKAASKKRKAEDAEDGDESEDAKPAVKKRGKAKQEVDLEDADAKAAAKPKGRKKAAPKKEEVNSEDDEEKPAPPAKKARAKAVKKEETNGEDDEEKPIPAKKSRAKAVKKEEAVSEDEEEKPVPAKKSRAKKAAVKKEEDVEMDGVDEDIKPAPAKKPRAKKAAVKKEEDVEMDGADEDVKPAPAKKPRAKKAAVKKEASENSDAAPAKAAPKKRGKAAKKEMSNPGMTDGSSPDEAAADLPSDLPELVDAPGAEAIDAVSDPVVADNSLLEVESPEVKSKTALANPLDNGPAGKASKAKA